MRSRRATEPLKTGLNDEVPGVIGRGTHSGRQMTGLRGFVTPTLEGIERRRSELLALLVVVLVAVSLAVATLAAVSVELPGWLSSFGLTNLVVRLSLVGLVASFSVYVVQRERQLSKISKFLVNEQVLSAALSNRLKEISLLSEAGKAVSSSLELEDVLNIILNAAFELLGANEGSVMLVDDDELVVAAAVGHPKLFVGDRHPVVSGPSGWVAARREALLIGGSPAGEDVPHTTLTGHTILSAMSVPLEARSELLGVLNLNVTEGDRRFTEYELRALGLFAQHAALAIRHARALSREREMRMHADELDRVRSELLGAMAHDLKTPLTSIIGGAKMLLARSDQLDEETQRDFLSAIERQAQRLVELIDRLLAAARSQARHVPLSSGPLDLVPLLSTIAQSFSAAYGRDIQVFPASPRVPAHADADAVERVLANLLENAVKHTEPGVRVWVEAKSDDSVATVTVCDEGPGIPEDVMPTIFAPFRTADPSRAGTGLGLFVVSNLVQAMGGDVSVASPRGGGATFTFTLPTHAEVHSA